MTNGSKQQPLFSNPLALFLVGVGVALILVVLAVMVLRPGGMLKTGIPGVSQGACYYPGYADDVIYYQRCKYVTDRDCSTDKKEIFVAGLPCFSSPKGVLGVLMFDRIGRDCKAASEEDGINEMCKNMVRKDIANNEYPLWDGEEICSNESWPVIKVEPVVVGAKLLLPSPEWGVEKCETLCVGIVECISSPSLSPSSSPKPSPKPS